MTTKIEWCQETWNPVTGCTKISEGCVHCYAQRMANRLKGRYGYPSDEPFRVTFHPDRLSKPMSWGKPRMVFVCSMGDLFHKDVRPEWIAATIKAAMSANRKQYKHTWLFLTKRPQNIIKWREWARHVCPEVAAWFQHKAWIGITAENQTRFDERWPVLNQIPAAVKFISVEPMLSKVDIEMVPCRYCNHPGDILVWPCPHCEGRRFELPNWIICGGESGPGARPISSDWARGLRDQCKSNGIPFFFKQWGGPNKKQTGNVLDGQTYTQMPFKYLHWDEGMEYDEII